MKKLALSASLALVLFNQAVAHDLSCSAPGTWVDGRSGKEMEARDVIRKMAGASAVLLGESHGIADIQLWQATTAAAVSAQAPVQYGYEMFPRSSQPSLNSWSAGELDFPKFLVASNWVTNWGFDSKAYEPILRLPKIQSAPAKGLNIDRTLVQRVNSEGWANIPEGEKKGLSDPAPAQNEYKAWLREVLDMKASMEKKPDPSKERKLDRFVEAQQVWDRAFAEGIKDALDQSPERLMIAFLGRGHVDFGYGAQHQLSDIGVNKVVSAVTLFGDDDCRLGHDAADRPVADFVYILPKTSAEIQGQDFERPRIGVFIEDAKDEGVGIIRVIENSPADEAGFKTGDIVVQAAGKAVKTAADLGQTIRSHTWGAWLPFLVKRDGLTLELVAKLPVNPPKP
jgi:uncharacterized iron-regulated protein